MSDDFKAEVSNGYLLIAIKIPTTTCAACGKVYTPDVNPEVVTQLYRCHYALDSAFMEPWCGAEPRWGFVYGPEVPDERAYGGKRSQRAIVCGTCFAPVAKLDAAAEDMKREAHAKVGAAIKTWMR